MFLLPLLLPPAGDTASRRSRIILRVRPIEGSESHLQPPQERTGGPRQKLPHTAIQEQSHSASNSHSFESKGNNFLREREQRGAGALGEPTVSRRQKLSLKPLPLLLTGPSPGFLPSGDGLSVPGVHCSSVSELGVKQVVESLSAGQGELTLAPLSPKLVAWVTLAASISPVCKTSWQSRP